MFPNLGQIMEMVPKLEAFSNHVVAVVDNILAEQKAQRALLENILAKLDGKPQAIAIETEKEGQ